MSNDRSGHMLTAWALGGLAVLADVWSLQLRAESYMRRGRVYGLTDDRLRQILREEYGRAEVSGAITSMMAIEKAEQRAADEAIRFVPAARTILQDCSILPKR